MNAMQCQVRNEIYMTAELRGFHFDKVAVGAFGDYLRAAAWVGRQVVVSRILFSELFSDYPGRKRDRFCDDICEQIISRDEVMSKDEIIYRRNEAIGMRQITIRKGFYDPPSVLRP